MVGIHFIHFTFTEWRSENCDRWLRWIRRWCMSRWHTGYRDLISRGSASVIGCSNIHRLIMTKKNNRITKAISMMGKVSVQCWKIQSPTSKLCCSPPDNALYTPPPPALQEAWVEPQPGCLFAQLANQSTDDNN